MQNASLISKAAAKVAVDLHPLTNQQQLLIFKNSFAGMMIANTDTIHYLPFSGKVYRFFPTLIFPEDASRYHGDNERIGVEDYKRVIDFYFRLMQNADLVFDLAPDAEPLKLIGQDEEL